MAADLDQGSPQLIVPNHYWQSARSTGDWTLVSCAVSPGFRFDGFTLATPEFEIPRQQDRLPSGGRDSAQSGAGLRPGPAASAPTPADG